MEKVFSKEEKEKIFELYNNGMGIVNISKEVHTSPKKVKLILLNEYNIDIAKPNSKANNGKLPFGYWNVKENCEEAAKQCRNRLNFQQKFLGAYQASKRNNWLDEFAEKYFTDKTMYSSYDSLIHCVYSYEFEDNYVYVGRTTNLKRRHRSHKDEGENDSVYKHSVEYSVNIPEPKVLEEGLTAFESQVKEDEWINIYQNNGWNILNKAKTGANIGSLGAVAAKWTYDTCKEAAAKCKNKEEFKKKYSRAHNVSRENGWIDEFFPFNSKKNNGCFDTLEGCKEASKDFKTILQIRNEYPFLYHKISKNKWIEEIRAFIGETKEERKKYSLKKKGVEYFDFNNNNTSKNIYNENEIKFFKIIGCGGVIDNNSVSGDKFYVRVDAKRIIFMLVNVRNNGSFKSLNQNSYLIKILNYCTLIGYRLVIIYDSELVYKENIIKNKIEYYLGNKKLNCRTINARECEVCGILGDIAKGFLNKYHIQGYVASSIYLGAYYGSELIGVMTFKNGGITSNEWVLNRFATSDKYICCGVGGKLFKHFVDNCNVNKVVSFSDKRWGINCDENIYTKIGFVKDSETPLSYYYFSTDNSNVPHLENKITVSNKMHNSRKMTETEMAKELGYDRIWDCGLIKYVWERKRD